MILASVSSPAIADDKAAEEPANAIIVTAPGALLERNQTNSVDADAIAGAGHRDLIGALSRSIPAVTVDDAQGNPFEPNLIYRGFTASPLQGQPQGIAVYLDGGRFNQPFGDTVQFDLLPSAAIERVDLFDTNPVYGLNALGGAMVIRTKTGLDARGSSLSAAAGSYGESQLIAESGWSKGEANGYFALERDHDAGWRRFSPSNLLKAFADLGWDAATAGIHLKLLAADTDLTGNGTAPIDLLHADYRAVFTVPDITKHQYFRASAHPWLSTSDSSRLQASLYWQQLNEQTVNGDTADIAPCADAASTLCLAAADDSEALLLDQAGEPIRASIGEQPYGVLNLSSSVGSADGILVQFVDAGRVGAHQNSLVLGLSFDASRTDFRSKSELGILTDTRAVAGLGPIIAQPDGSIAPVSVGATTRYLGLFGSDHFDLTRRLAIEADFRWNGAAVDLHDHIGTALSGSHRYERFNPALKFEWQVARGAVLHAGYSQTNRAPTPAELACADPRAPCSLTNFFVGDPSLKQVTSRSLDFGAEGKLGHVDWKVSAYRSTNVDDIQDVASGIRGRAFFENVGTTRRQGLEATLTYFDRGLTVRAGYALTDATFGTALLLNSPDNPDADANDQIHVRAGDELPGIPRHRGILSVNYDQKSWSAGGDVQLASNQRFFGDEANLIKPLAGYVVANLRASFLIKRSLRFFAEVRNVFDKHYATFGTFAETASVFLKEAPGATDPRSVSPGAPRRWLAGISTQF